MLWHLEPKMPMKKVATKEEKWTAVLAYFDKEDQKVSLAEYKTKEHKQNKTKYASIWDKLDLKYCFF